MIRRRKSADITSQLGEPLPLPYQADSVRVKKEKTYEALLPSRSTSTDVGVQSRIHSGTDHPRANSFPESYIQDNYADDRVPLPIWRKTSNGAGKRDINNSDYSIDHINYGVPNGSTEEHEFGEHVMLIRTLQQKLDDLKQEYENNENSDVLSRSNLKTLEKMGDDLDTLLQECQQKHILQEKQHIIQELEKYQRLSTPIEKKRPLRWYIVTGICVVFMLLMSFLAGHFSYEYCYYIC